jgi:predicted DNA-binding mobile mystery protein A
VFWGSVEEYRHARAWQDHGIRQIIILHKTEKCHIEVLPFVRNCNSIGWQMSVSRAKQRQAEGKINQAAQMAQAFVKPLGGWIATFQEAIGMSAPALAERLGVSRNSVYSSIQNEQAGTVSLNQLDKMAEAMGGKLVYAIIPREGSVEEIVMAQARKKARRIIQRTRAHMALEEQTEGLRSLEEMIEDLAEEIAREMPRDFWK